MAEPRPQSYANHRKYVPGFHFALAGLIVVLFLWAVWRLIVGAPAEAAFDLLLVAGLAGLFYYTRLFPLRAQDRVIRLEMQLRLAGLLPPDLAARIDELSRGQLIALRFASDAELPELTRRCLDEKLRRREEIKRQIEHWVPDHHRL